VDLLRLHVEVTCHSATVVILAWAFGVGRCGTRELMAQLAAVHSVDSDSASK
jgi:hypothetical protein